MLDDDESGDQYNVVISANKESVFKVMNISDRYGSFFILSVHLAESDINDEKNISSNLIQHIMYGCEDKKKKRDKNIHENIFSYNSNFICEKDNGDSIDLDVSVFTDLIYDVFTEYKKTFDMFWQK